MTYIDVIQSDFARLSVGRKGDEEVGEKRGGKTEFSEQRDEFGQSDIDSVSIEDSNVEHFGAVKNGNAKVLALVEELLAVVHGSTGATRASAADTDAVAIQSRNVEQLSAVGDGNADIDTLVNELLSIVGASWSGRCGRARARARAARFGG